ncbi:DNA internalization-related competence protein ComEC/Rec2 [Lactococcus raffinolactis]|nr:DNA internalization-related competence protein ComEC/Rec2 [Lactococcus raffinolactis]
MSKVLERRQLKNLKKALRWINLPSIFIAYFCVLIYYTVFCFSYLLLGYLIISLLILIWQNGIRTCLKLSMILIGFATICLALQDREAKDFAREMTVTRISPILDTIQVDGDQVSFRGKSGKQTYQVYYRVTTEQEQRYFKQLAQPVVLSISGQLEKASQQRNFNGFDYQHHLKTQNIYRVLTIEQVTGVTRKQTLTLALLRQKAILFSEQHFPRPMSAYMTGLLFGHLGKDFEDMSSIYTSLGIMHLFALSGMQVSFFIDFLRKGMLRLGFRRDVVDWFQIPFSVFYAGLTGFSISVNRSLVQKILANFGIKALDNFSLTLLLLFITAPKFLLTTGGTLSLLFAFVISIFGDRFENLPKYRKLLAESLTLSLCVLPLLILYFHTFQPVSIILTFVFSFLFDILFLPGLSVIFLLAMVTGFTLTQVNLIFQWLEDLIKLTDSWWHYPLVLGKPTALVFLVTLVVTGFLIDHWQNRKVSARLAIILMGLFFITKNPPTPSITMVDVGQGYSIFLQDKFNRRSILIDTGGRIELGKKKKWQERKIAAPAEKTLIPYLKSRGVGQIDTLVLTHTHEDHMGDLLAVIDQIKVKNIIVSQGSLNNAQFVKLLKQTRAKVQVAKVGQRLKIFDSYLEVLYPLTPGDGKNNDSIVLYGKLYGTKFLLTGDLEETGERELLTRYPNLSVDVLKVGHHGSKTSSSESFIEAIRPKVGLISCGLDNRYGHPNMETLTTFQKYEVQTFRTDYHGAIKFKKNSKFWHISTVK